MVLLEAPELTKEDSGVHNRFVCEIIGRLNSQNVGCFSNVNRCTVVSMPIDMVASKKEARQENLGPAKPGKIYIKTETSSTSCLMVACRALST